jgi:hypothetical protein
MSENLTKKRHLKFQNNTLQRQNGAKISSEHVKQRLKTSKRCLKSLKRSQIVCCFDVSVCLNEIQDLH